MKKYIYGMRLRGFSPGCQPLYGLIQIEDDPAGRYYNLLTYNRPMTADEIENFELELVGVTDDFWPKFVNNK